VSGESQKQKCKSLKAGTGTMFGKVARDIFRINAYPLAFNGNENR
jgi:hypothetical protein